jgi:hypothetical protein
MKMGTGKGKMLTGGKNVTWAVALQSIEQTSQMIAT